MYGATLRRVWRRSLRVTRRILITGGAGFIGSHLADALLARGDRLVLLDDFSTGRRDTIAHLLGVPALEVVEGSTLDAKLVDDLVAATDATLHLASAVGVQLIVSSPLSSLLGNVRGTDNVFASAVTTRQAAAVHVDLGGLRQELRRPARRGRRPHPRLARSSRRWAYAMAKGFGEALAHGYYRDCEAEMIVARLFNTSGRDRPAPTAWCCRASSARRSTART